MWGCCAVDIIQDFKQDPDEKASIQVVDGDGGQPVMHPDGGFKFCGPTYKDIFLQRLRFGTFGSEDMPSHGFIAILTEEQINGAVGKKWLAILKENGFEFQRTVCNSVYSGRKVAESYSSLSGGMNKNYIFALYRNIGRGATNDPFTPPKAWTDLPQVKSEFWELVDKHSREDMACFQFKTDMEIWDRIGPVTFLSEQEVRDAGAPVTLAGLRSKYPQQTKEARDALKAVENRSKDTEAAPKNIWGFATKPT